MPVVGQSFCRLCYVLSIEEVEKTLFEEEELIEAEISESYEIDWVFWVRSSKLLKTRY